MKTLRAIRPDKAVSGSFGEAHREHWLVWHSRKGYKHVKKTLGPENLKYLSRTYCGLLGAQ